MSSSNKVVRCQGFETKYLRLRQYDNFGLWFWQLCAGRSDRQTLWHFEHLSEPKTSNCLSVKFILCCSSVESLSRCSKREAAGWPGPAGDARPRPGQCWRGWGAERETGPGHSMAAGCERSGVSECEGPAWWPWVRRGATPPRWRRGHQDQS